MKEELKKFFEQYGKLSAEGLEALTNKFKLRRVKKNELILSQEKICDKIYFVVKGCLRLYYIINDVEVTVWFSFENNSAIELSSFLSQLPSDYFIEAVEDSEILSLHKSDLTSLYKNHPEMESVFRVFWENVIITLLERFTALQKYSAEERYLNLMSQSDYLQRIPQKHLASYIGITPTSLSRIRKNIK
jgi:CRP-like cAMP-binding protein